MAKGITMEKKLVIPGKLPGLNEYTTAERTHRQKAARIKSQVQEDISWCIKRQLKKTKFDKPVHMAYTWIEPNRYRDKDNIAFAKKFIQDALVRNGVLKNDGWKEIDGFSDSFEVDRENPRVEVEISDEV